MRSKIKTFASFAINSKVSKNSPYPCPPYKIIILDEADNMTRDAQTALRRTMEKYSNVTRFCLICNYVSKIISPVASRCAKFRFQLLNNKSMLNKLKYITKQEKLIINDKTLNKIIDISCGDMRKCITLLQSASLMKPIGNEITLNDVNSVIVTIDKTFVSNKIIPIMKKNVFENVKNLCDYIINEGLPVTLLLERIIEYIIDANELNDMQKSNIAINIAETDLKLCEGANEYLQLLAVLGNIHTIYKNIS